MKLRSFLPATLCLIPHLLHAATPISGWYNAVSGGYTSMPNNVSVTPYYRASTWDRAVYQDGFNAGLHLGYQSNPLRYEFEVAYIQDNLEDFRLNLIPQTGVTGNTHAWVGLASVYYDFNPLVPAISPFVGTGLGYAAVAGSLRSTGPLGYTRYEGSNNVFAYHGTAGITYNFAENYALQVAYRYLGTARVDELGKVFQANMAVVTVMYRFNEVAYK